MKAAPGPKGDFSTKKKRGKNISEPFCILSRIEFISLLLRFQCINCLKVKKVTFASARSATIAGWAG